MKAMRRRLDAGAARRSPSGRPAGTQRATGANRTPGASRDKGGVSRIEFNLLGEKLKNAQAEVGKRDAAIAELNEKVEKANSESTALRKKLADANTHIKKLKASQSQASGDDDKVVALEEQVGALQERVKRLSQKLRGERLETKRLRQAAGEEVDSDSDSDLDGGGGVDKASMLRSEVRSLRRASVVLQGQHESAQQEWRGAKKALEQAVSDAKEEAQRSRSAADEARATLAVRMQELEDARRTTAALREELRDAALQARNDLDSLERKMEVKAEESRKDQDETWKQAMHSAKDAWEGRLQALQQELQECKQAWKKDVAEKEAAASATHARLVAKVQAEHAEVIQSLRSQYNASVAELKKNLEEAAQRQEKEYMERSTRDHQEHERRVAQLASERRAELAQAEQEKEAAIKREEDRALEAQRTLNTRVEALLARIEHHEEAESEAMRGKAVAEAAMLELQAQLTRTAAARKSENQAAAKQITELKQVVAKMVRSSEELQSRAGKLVAEAAAQSVAVVEEAALTNTKHEAQIAKMKKLVASLQATQKFLQGKVVEGTKEKESVTGELAQARAEIKRMAAAQNTLHQQITLQKTLSMDLLRRFSAVTGGAVPYEQMMELGAGLRAPPSTGTYLMTGALQRDGTTAGPGAMGGFSPVARPGASYSPDMPPPPPPQRAPPSTSSWTPVSRAAKEEAQPAPARLHGHGRHVEAAHAQHGAHADSALGTARSGAVWASVLNGGGDAQPNQHLQDTGPRSAIGDLLGAGLDIQDIARATARRTDM